MNNLILFNKIPQEGTPYNIAVNVRNVVEVSPNGEGRSWMKYWDGAQIRSCVVEGTPEEIVNYDK